VGIQSARSLEKVLTAQLGKVNSTFGTPALDELGGRRITILGPKGLRQECQSFIYFLKSVEFGVKKKNLNSSVSEWTIRQDCLFQ